jgi:hypothetical protein
MPLNDTETTLEMVLPILVTEVYQKLESEGKHPEEDFTERFRKALLLIIPKYDNIEEDIWVPEIKQRIILELCEVIEL